MGDAPREPRAVEGRVPPHDLDAECAVLSAVMLDTVDMREEFRPETRAIDVCIAQGLRDVDFYSEANKRICEAAFELHRVGQPTDVIQIGTWLKNRERIGQIGGMEYLSEIMNAAPAVTNVRHYVDTVIEKARVRRLIATCQTIAAEGYLDYGIGKDFLEGAEARIHAIVHEHNRPGDGFGHIREPLKLAVKTIMAASQNGHVSGIPTGFERFDRITGGLHPGDLTIVAARPGMGKTGLVLEVLITIGMRPEEACLFESLEMPNEQLGLRAIATEGKIDLGKMRQGFMSPTDMGRMSRVTQEVGKSGVWTNDRPAATLAHLRADIRRARIAAERDGRKLRVLAVDYLQLMGNAAVKGRGQRTREQEVAENSKGLKEIAKSEGLAVVALSQLNRAVETRGEKSRRPQLSDLRESGSIEQDADNIVFIYRDEYYTKDQTTEPNIAELIVAKQRNGPTGTAKVRFDKEWVRFDNLAEGEYVDE